MSKDKNEQKFGGGGGGGKTLTTKKKWIIGIVIFVCLSVIYRIGAGNQPTEPTGKQKQTEISQVETTQNQTEDTEVKEAEKDTEQTETVELTTEEKIRAEIENVVGKENLITFNYVPGNNFSLIKFKGSENLTTKLTVKGMYIDIFNILKAIQPINDTDVDFNIVFPMVDVKGNSKEMIVIKATYKNDTIQTINYDRPIYENIPLMADEWWNHNALDVENIK